MEVIDVSKVLFNAGQEIAIMNMLLDEKLPVDVTFNGGTNKAGTTLRTLAFRIRAFNEVQEYVKSLDVEDVKRKLERVS